MTRLVSNPILKLFLWLVDLRRQSQGELGRVKRILIANLAHLGDVVIATSVIEPLKEAFPDVEIGFLCGSWAKDLLKVDFIHTIDHYKHDRNQRSYWQYFRSKLRVIKEIRQLEYDLAIDLYYYFGNAAHIFYQANIPVRVGYTSGGFGKYYTHPVIWNDLQQHVSAYNTQLLKEIGVQTKKFKGHIPYVVAEESGYTILHPGSGDRNKSWNGWPELIELLPNSHQLAVTGCNEPHLTDPIARLGVRNFADKLSLQEWAGLIQGARLVIAVDSAIVHIASAFDVPCIGIYSNRKIAEQWHGNSTCSVPLVNPSVSEVLKQVKILALQRSTRNKRQ